MCRIARRSADQPHTLAQQCRRARTAKPGTLGHMHARRMHALLLERLSPYTDPSQPPRRGRQSWAHPRLPHLHRDWAHPPASTSAPELWLPRQAELNEILSAVEFLDRASLELVEKHLPGCKDPLDAPCAM
jgi:hypothetical protein